MRAVAGTGLAQRHRAVDGHGPGVVLSGGHSGCG